MDKRLKSFDPKIHICKFGFELYDYATFNPIRYNIIGNLYEKEIVFEFIDKKKEEVVEVFGYKISEDKYRSLLPLVCWENFEKYRDLPKGWEWRFENGNAGYRDGWGYKFWCLSESGYPLLEVYMNCFFSENELPAYEKLLKWLRDNYKVQKGIKEKNMLW